MPWIDTTITEGQFQNDLTNLLAENAPGWTRETYFKKVVFPSSLISPSGTVTDRTIITIYVTQHYIYKSPGNLRYGVAMSGKIEVAYGDIPDAINPRLTKVQDADGNVTGDWTSFGVWATNIFPKVKNSSTIYFYMAESIHADLLTNEDVTTPFDDDLLRCSLDIESLLFEGVYKDGSFRLKAKKAMVDTMQSPISPVNLRMPTLQSSDTKYGTDGIIQTNNWWHDSLISVRGWIDDSAILLILKADSSAAYMNNLVPSFPMFWCKLDPLDLNDTQNHLLLAGTALDTDNPKYDYDSPTPYGKIYMPVFKNYQYYPSNAIDSIMMHRTKYGARYQAHYLSWNVAPNEMEPIRNLDGSDYPDAWLRPDSHVHNFRFNTSRYTNKVHSSKAYVIHPEEGVRGTLPKIILTNPLSLLAGDRLKVRKSVCPDTFDVYKFNLIDSISPFTKKPSTAYRPAGLGIYEKEQL